MNVRDWNIKQKNIQKLSIKSDHYSEKFSKIKMMELAFLCFPNWWIDPVKYPNPGIYLVGRLWVDVFPWDFPHTLDKITIIKIRKI